MCEMLPPMNALRPFVETARTGATTLAAIRLNRSHGAVCRQIKILEERFGVLLFKRQQGRLVLTEAGSHYFEVVSKALSLLERASLDLARTNEDKTIRVACTTVFAKRWLLPRLEVYCEANPTVNLHIVKSTEGATPPPSEFDVAILSSPAVGRHVEADPLMPELIFPVKGRRTTRQRGSDDAMSFIHTADTLASWSRWSEGVPHNRGKDKHLRIEDLDVAISAAALGRGMLIARGQLIIDELATGALGLYGEMAKQIDTAYWLIQPPMTARSPIIRSFSTFIRSEALVSFDELKRRVPCLIEKFDL
ncbi:LysR family transcriptional regulator [Methylorubrum thiocyanatum]|uniref:LysR family transcriptional regulator n=1 Tax=Methylorubrum thiocyanatum TaxID=47958 RepID=UPI003F7EC3A7